MEETLKSVQDQFGTERGSLVTNEAPMFMTGKPSEAAEVVIDGSNVFKQQKKRMKSAVHYSKDPGVFSSMTTRNDIRALQPKIWEATKFYNVPALGGFAPAQHHRQPSLFSPLPQHRFSAGTFQNKNKNTVDSKRIHSKPSRNEPKLMSMDMATRMDFNIKKHGVDQMIKQNKLINSIAFQKHRIKSTASNAFKEPTSSNMHRSSKDYQHINENSIDSTKMDLEQKGQSISSIQEEIKPSRQNKLQAAMTQGNQFQIVTEFTKPRLLSAKVGPQIANIRSTKDILAKGPSRADIGISPLTQHHVIEIDQSKVFTSKEDRNVGYILHPTSSQESNFVYKSRERKEAKEQIAEALRQNKVPQDLLLEMQMKHRFVQTNKGQDDMTSNFSQLREFVVSPGSNIKLLQSSKSTSNGGGTRSIRTRYREFQQEHMEHEVFENNVPVVPIQKFKQQLHKVSKEQICTSIERLLGYKTANASEDVKRNSLVRVPSDELLTRKTHKAKDKMRFDAQFDQLMTDLVSNMSIFDKNLKLKIQMNIDLIQQDAQVWQNQYMDFLNELNAQNHTEVTEEMLLAPYQKKSEAQLENMLETMQEIVKKLKVEPLHHDLKAVDCPSQMYTNLYKIKTQQEVQIQDLTDVADITHQLMQRQSIHWQIHSTTSVTKQMRRRRTTFNETSIKDFVDGLKHITPEQQEADLYNSFLVNKILNLNNIYLLTVINKQMEMEQLSQERQLTMLKNQIQTMKKETKLQVDKMEMHYNIAVRDTKKQVEELETQLQFYKQQYRSLMATVRDQEEEIHAIRFVGREGTDPIMEIMQKFNREMNSLQSGIDVINVEKEQVVRLMEFMSKMKQQDLRWSKHLRKKQSQKMTSPKKSNALSKSKDIDVMMSSISSAEAESSRMQSGRESGNILNIRSSNPVFCDNCKKRFQTQPAGIQTSNTIVDQAKRQSRIMNQNTMRPEIPSQLTQSSNSKTKSKIPSKSNNSSKNLVGALAMQKNKTRNEFENNAETQNFGSRGQNPSENFKNFFSGQDSDQSPNMRGVTPDGIDRQMTNTVTGKHSLNITDHHTNMLNPIASSSVVSENSNPNIAVWTKPEDQISEEIRKKRRRSSANRGNRPLHFQPNQTSPKAAGVQKAGNKQTLQINVEMNNKQASPVFGEEYTQPVSTTTDIMKQGGVIDYLVMPETTIVRLIEVAVDDFIKLEVRFLSNPKQSNLKNLMTMSSFRSYFQQFLQIQYGNNQLSSSYFRTIIEKLKNHAMVTDNYFAHILFSLINNQSISIRPDFQLKVWTKEQQRVAIYTIGLFDDALKSSFSTLKAALSPSKRSVSPRYATISSILKNGGEYISIFDLSDMITKVRMSDINFMIAEALPPHHFFHEASRLDSDQLESHYLTLGKMRLTDRFIKMNHDTDRFLQIIVSNQNQNKMKFEQLFTEIARHYQIYFSIEEQIAIRNAMFPDKRMEDISVSGQRMIRVRTTLESQNSVESKLILSEGEYLEKLPLFMISKTEFIILVEQQWVMYMNDLHAKIITCFGQLDSLLNVGGLNETQFYTLVENELNFDIRFSFNSTLSKPEFFNFVLKQFACQNNQVPLDVIQMLLIEHNLDVFPFARYFHSFKFYQNRFQTLDVQTNPIQPIIAQMTSSNTKMTIRSMSPTQQLNDSVQNLNR